MKPINIDVKVRDNESVERALKRFTRKVKKEGILQDVRERMRFEKPSAKKARVAKQRKKVLDKLKRERDTI
tara:strand:- start:148 stop:360 length:213 start_codon:yes stop_codon:yes gene_type:complete